MYIWILSESVEPTAKSSCITFVWLQTSTNGKEQLQNTCLVADFRLFLGEESWWRHGGCWQQVARGRCRGGRWSQDTQLVVWRDHGCGAGSAGFRIRGWVDVMSILLLSSLVLWSSQSTSLQTGWSLPWYNHLQPACIAQISLHRTPVQLSCKPWCFLER